MRTRPCTFVPNRGIGLVHLQMRKPPGPYNYIHSCTRCTNVPDHFKINKKKQRRTFYKKLASKKTHLFWYIWYKPLFHP
jgi:hypothetical protein